MTENPFEQGIQIINEAIKEIYQQIEDYLQNIYNSPSTINRILTHYVIAFDPTETNKLYIMFNGVIVKEYETVIEKLKKMKGDDME